MGFALESFDAGSTLEGGFPGGSDDKESSCNARDPGLIPGPGRSPEKEKASHFSILVWRTPWTEEAGGPQFVGSQSQTQLSMHTACSQVCSRAK